MAPASTARRMSASASKVVRTSTRVSGKRAAISAVAVAPSISGIWRHEDHVGPFPLGHGQRLAPEAASPTTSKSASLASIPRSPSRTTGWSSAIRSRITQAP